MSGVLPLHQLTSDFLKSVEATKFLPELVPLKKAIENNIGHNQQSVFDHIVAVMVGLEWVIPAEFLTQPTQLKFTKLLSQKVDTHAKLDLMRAVVVMHDLAKGETLVTNSLGQTSCPGHEILAAGMVPSFATRFDLTQLEVDYIQQIIRLHGTPHDLLTLGLAKPDQATSLIRAFNLATNGLGLELILMVYADLLGGNLDKLNPAEFTARTNLCQTWLQKLLPDLA